MSKVIAVILTIIFLIAFLSIFPDLFYNYSHTIAEDGFLKFVVYPVIFLFIIICSLSIISYLFDKNIKNKIALKISTILIYIIILFLFNKPLDNFLIYWTDKSTFFVKIIFFSLIFLTLFNGTTFVWFKKEKKELGSVFNVGFILLVFLFLLCVMLLYLGSLSSLMSFLIIILLFASIIGYVIILIATLYFIYTSFFKE